MPEELHNRSDYGKRRFLPSAVVTIAGTVPYQRQPLCALVVRRNGRGSTASRPVIHGADRSAEGEVG